MNTLIKYARVFSVLIITLVFSSAALAAEKAKAPAAVPAASGVGESVVDKGWSKRCEPVKADEKKGSEHCEIFQRVETQKGALRVVEFGIGYLPGSDMARGVVVLPLGILLEQGVTMKIDDGKPFSFSVRYCVVGGCFSYVNMDKPLLSSMKKGKVIKFEMKKLDGNTIDLEMKLEGFEKVLKEIS